MARIVHLQNLPSEATSANVRDFFEGFFIEDGGVHITSSYCGSAFITLANEHDAWAAVKLDGKRIFGETVKLSLCTEQEKQERVHQLDEEEKIFADVECDRDDEGAWPYDSKFGIAFEGNTVRAKRHWTKDRRHDFEYSDNYIRVRNIPRGNGVKEILRFFKGIQSAIPHGHVLVHEDLNGTMIAFIKIQSRRAFEIALKMDESVLDGRIIVIEETSPEEFESEYSRKNVRAAAPVEGGFRRPPPHTPANNFGPSSRPPRPEEHPRIFGPPRPAPLEADKPFDVEPAGGPPDFGQARQVTATEVPPDGYHHNKSGQMELCVYVKNLPVFVTEKNIRELFEGKCIMQRVLVKPDNRAKNKNMARIVVPNEEEIKKALTLNNFLYEGQPLSVYVHKTGDPRFPYLFIAGLNENISPKEIRVLFGNLASAIPADGILIRPDARGNGYVAFVKFNNTSAFFKAKDIWKGHNMVHGTKIYVSPCTEHLLRNYKIGLIWGSQDIKNVQGFGNRPGRKRFRKRPAPNVGPPPPKRHIGEEYPHEPPPFRSMSQPSMQAQERADSFRSRSRSPLREWHSPLREAVALDSPPRHISRSPVDRGLFSGPLPLGNRPLPFGNQSPGSPEPRASFFEAQPPRDPFPGFPFPQFTNHPGDRSPPPFGFETVVRRRSRSISPRLSPYRSPARYRSRSRSRSWSPMSRSPGRRRSPSGSYSPRRTFSRSRSRSWSRSPPRRRSRSRSPPLPSMRPSQYGEYISHSEQRSRYIRVSPLPSWANADWLCQFFSDCALKRETILMKYNAGIPVHAYLECVTDADVDRACYKNGMLVQNRHIVVERLGK